MKETPQLSRDELARALDASEPQTVADTAVQLAAALFEADITALWWFRDDLPPRLVARAPTGTDEVDALEPDDVVATQRVPFRVDDLGGWELVLHWRSAPSDEVPTEALQRFVAQLDATMLRATERKMREESHLELADNVAQALVVANTLFEMGNTQGAQDAVLRALEQTKQVMNRLQRENPRAVFVRLYPSSVEVLGGDEEE